MPLDTTRPEAHLAGSADLESPMDRYIHEQNMAHYRRLLAEASVMVEEERHKWLVKLLADEEAKDTLLAGRMIDPPL
jgi:hypothetical protein